MFSKLFYLTLNKLHHIPVNSRCFYVLIAGTPCPGQGCGGATPCFLPPGDDGDVARGDGEVWGMKNPTTIFNSL